MKRVFLPALLFIFGTFALPVHAAWNGPIVMIGFGSIGQGVLPLIYFENIARYVRAGGALLIHYGGPVITGAGTGEGPGPPGNSAPVPERECKRTRRRHRGGPASGSASDTRKARVSRAEGRA